MPETLPPLSSTVSPDVAAVVGRAVEIRHDLHRHPELGYQEHYTSGVIQAELKRLGVAFTAGLAGGTGVLGVIQGGRGSGKCVALRADMDALPIQETTGAAYASHNPGVMHACGHDGHVAVLLGAAAVLQARARDMKGTIKLLFQPAEEGGCGAEKMVRDGVLADPPVDAIFGLHGWPGLPVGMVASRPGAIMAAVDGFTIRVTGKEGHAAAPQQGIDPIVCAAAIVQGLQTIVSRELDPTEAAVVTVAQFHAGTAFNVIPEAAVLNGTVRTLDPKSAEAVRKSIERIATSGAAAYRCKATVSFEGTTPATINTAAEVAFVKKVAQQVLGPDCYAEAPKPAMLGEDFAFYLQKSPGCFFALGVNPHPTRPYPMLHNSNYDFTDDAVAVGVKMLSELAIQGLAG